MSSLIKIKQAIVSSAILVVLALSGGFPQNVSAQQQVPLYDIPTVTIDGEATTLARYRAKLLLIVNTASQCGFTPQYKGLEELYQRYKDRGLVVLAFPANNFRNQEPGSNAQIRDFCYLKYKTSFPLFAKISVKGDDIHPLYRYLTSYPSVQGEITWNFNKFLVSGDGTPIQRFPSSVEPLSPELVEAIEKNLPEK